MTYVPIGRSTVEGNEWEYMLLITGSALLINSLINTFWLASHNRYFLVVPPPPHVAIPEVMEVILIGIDIENFHPTVYGENRFGVPVGIELSSKITSIFFDS